jgi:hypothetical protein
VAEARELCARLDRREETPMYDILIMKNGSVPMTRRIDILKIIVVAAAIGILFYYLAHYGLSLPPGPSPR